MNLIYGRSPTRDEYERAFQLYGGDESGFLCLSCAEVNRIDSKPHPMKCKKCGASSLREVSGLAGTECPKCRQGRFDGGSQAGIS
jgi:Zn finger protein HypA/HybF involved in hydrogenase expression